VHLIYENLMLLSCSVTRNLMISVVLHQK
jgi:hypothetical protein